MKLIPLDNYLLYEGKYLSFFKRKFLDKDGKSKEYEYIERNKNQKAVVIIAQKENQILLIKQYRIPVLNYVIEFPAGLMDENEKIEQTAVRELLEETGYRAEIVEISPLILTSAGLTTEQIYFVKVNLLDFEGTNCESSEDIEVFWVNKEKWEKLKKDNIYINGWVYAYLEGLYN
ncbi:MAG: NUDIX domain-containing protein [Exilispira sp.]